MTKPGTLTADRRIRFALVGCGRIARNHLTALQGARDQAELVAVCDVDPEAMREASATNGAKGYGSLSALLADSDADVVVLATPSGLHPEQAIQIAQAGRHVMTEKPMATRWEDGKRMVQACDSAGVRLFVVKQNRYNATLQLAKRAVASHRFGRIYIVILNVFWTRPQSYFDSARWRGTWEFDGGAFMNQASHYVDLLDWLIGPVESVYTYTATLARDIQVEDTGVAAVRWRTGALGSVNVTMLTYPKNLEGSITIIGEKGTVRIGGVAVNEIQHWEFAEPAPEDEMVRKANYATTSVYGFGHPAYYDNVIKVLRGEAEPQTDGREGLRSLEILIAIYRSARDGTRVSLPLEYSYEICRRDAESTDNAVPSMDQQKLDRITERIIGCAIEVHRHIGPGLLESVYESALSIELSEQGLTFERQKALPVFYKVQAIGEFRIDLLVEGAVIVELKSVERVDPIFSAQLLSYLKLGGYELGLLINFNSKLLKDGIKRIILSGR